MFEDRTKAHADHVGHGLDRMTTAAVGKNMTFSLTLLLLWFESYSLQIM